MKQKFVVVSFLILLVSSFYLGSVYQVNADQAQIYNATVQAQLNRLRNQTPITTSSGGNIFRATVQTTAEFFVTIHYGLGHGLSVNQTLLKQGFTADCIQFCFNGINYFKDPTTIIVNQGRGIEQCLVFGATTTDTCTASNFAKVLGWSVATQTPANGDTFAGGATIPCSSANVIVDANGLRDVAGTVTTAANAATITTTVSKAFSITGTYTAVQVSCVLSALDNAVNPLIYAEATFGPDSFVSGDSLTGTWQISRT